MNHSIVILVPAEHAETLRAISEAQGWGGGITAEAFSDGTPPATHYGARAWADDAALATLTDLKANPPAGTEDAVASTIIDDRPDAPGIGREHWMDVLTANGLMPVQQDEQA